MQPKHAPQYLAFVTPAPILLISQVHFDVLFEHRGMHSVVLVSIVKSFAGCAICGLLEAGGLVNQLVFQAIS
jgi:hypothetical protein